MRKKTDVPTRFQNHFASTLWSFSSREVSNIPFWFSNQNWNVSCDLKLRLLIEFLQAVWNNTLTPLSKLGKYIQDKKIRFNLLVWCEIEKKNCPTYVICPEMKTESCREEQVAGFSSEYCTVASGYRNLLILFYCLRFVDMIVATWLKQPTWQIAR